MKQPSYYNFLGWKTMMIELKPFKLKHLSMIDFTEKNLVSLLTFYTEKDNDCAIICNNHPKHVTQIYPYQRKKSHELSLIKLFWSLWDFCVILLCSITKFDFHHSFSDGFKLFCPCGHVALIKCAECLNRGYCSRNCLDSDRVNHKILCRPKLLPPINPQKSTFTGWTYFHSKKEPNRVGFWSNCLKDEETIPDEYFSEFPLDFTGGFKTDASNTIYLWLYLVNWLLCMKSGSL